MCLKGVFCVKSVNKNKQFVGDTDGGVFKSMFSFASVLSFIAALVLLFVAIFLQNGTAAIGIGAAIALGFGFWFIAWVIEVMCSINSTLKHINKKLDAFFEDEE